MDGFGETTAVGVGSRSGPVDLALAKDFTLNEARVEPSRRCVRKDGKSVTVEPRVMQVLVVMHEAGFSTVSREMLMERCWPGVIVGDDAVNRAIGELRKALREVGCEATVETVPRVGYRLEGALSDDAGPSREKFPRRRVLALGAAGVGVVALAGGYVWVARSRRDPRVAGLLESAQQALREELPDRNAQGLGLLREAAKLAPGDAKVWGLNAVAWRNAAEYSRSEDTASAVRACEAAARRALAIDPKQGDALAALAILQPFYGDWIAAERRLLKVLEVASDTLPAISHLTTLYQSAGLVDSSRRMNARAIALDPLSPVFQFRSALKDWIYHDDQAADAGIERALELWPRHPAVWNARLMLFAYTGRAGTGLAFLGNLAARPLNVPAPSVHLWEVLLSAIAGGDKTAARAAAFAATQASVAGAVQAIMYFSYVGEVDAAWHVAEGFLLQRGPLAAQSSQSRRTTWVTDLGWRRSMLLFTPAVLSLRRNPRFPKLCEDMGLARFWRSRGKEPEYLAVDRSANRREV